MSNAVKVAVRARPLSERELKLENKIAVSMSGGTVRLHDPKGRASTGGAGPAIHGTKSFSYDYCYWSTRREDSDFASQEKVFSDLGVLLVENALSGYNASAMAYGQTGSGKTYTMMGTDREPGLVPRLCQALYDHIGANQDPNVSFRTEVSYMEIYNEHVGDLLAPGNRKKTQHNLRVREDPRRGPYVQGLTWHVVSDQAAMIERINVGNSVRTTAATKMNDTSSRSHAIFTIKFTHACFAADRPQETVSRINLVDLAGSERAKSTGATGSRLKEGSQINKSLVALGNVISALAEKSHASSGKSKKMFTPYRDSMLTWLLKDSLGGNSRTIMIATVSPAECNYGETLSTLRYASRAKDIVNKAVVNEDPNVRLIRELRAEISRLRSLLEASPNVHLSPNATVTQELAKNERLAEQLTQQWAGRWEETRQLAQGRKVAVKGEGVSVVMNAEVPHLVAISDDVLSTGIKLYYLEEGLTSMGTQVASIEGQPFDIELQTSSNTRICVDIINTSGSVTVRNKEGTCFLNGLLLTEEAELHQGQILLVGDNNLFRFQHPQEAAQMRKDMRERGVQPTSGFNTPSVLYAPMIEAQRRSVREAEEVVHDIDTSPEHTARSFTPDSMAGGTLFNPAEVADRLKQVRGYESDTSSSQSLLSPPSEGSAGESGFVITTTSPNGSAHTVQQQRLPSQPGGTPVLKPLAPLPEETASQSVSPTKGMPQSSLLLSNSSGKGGVSAVAGGDTGSAVTLTQKLAAEHTQEMQRASTQWEAEKAQLLAEIQRIQTASPQPPTTPAVQSPTAPTAGKQSGQRSDGTSGAVSMATKHAPAKPKVRVPAGGTRSATKVRGYVWSSSSPTDVNSDSSDSMPSSNEGVRERVDLTSNNPPAVSPVLSANAGRVQRAPRLSSSHSRSSSAWSGIRGQSNSMEVELILDSLDSDSSAMPTTDQLKRLSSAHRRQAQKFATTLQRLSSDNSVNSQEDLLAVQRSQQRQLARMAEIHHQLQQKLAGKKHGWEKINMHHVEQLASDRDGLMIQLNDLQEIIESQRVKLDSLYKDEVQKFSSFTISIDIPSTSRRGRGADLIIFYQIRVNVGSLQWCLDRSYASFRAFHETMMQGGHLPEATAGLFPPFKWFNTKGMAFVEKRREQLKVYIRHVLVNLSNDRQHSWHLANSETHLKELVCGQLPFFSPNTCAM